MEAMEKIHVFYKSMDIDYLKETISIPGIARKFLFKDTKAYFSLFGQEDKDHLHYFYMLSPGRRNLGQG